MDDSEKLFIKDIYIDWNEVERGSYLRDIASLRALSHLPLHCPVTFFCGENGTGKSTLLEAIAVACGFNPEGGTINYAFTTKDTHSALYQALRLSRSWRKNRTGYFLRAESFYNVATMEEEYAKGPGGVEHHYHEKSHGESFLALAQDYFRGDGLYLLDEPEAALSPQRQLSLIIEIMRCVRGGAQFFIATHSPILMGIPQAEILSFDDGTIHAVNYEETDSYRITASFLNGRERFLRQLLQEDEE